jgi:hypothetical protein
MHIQFQKYFPEYSNLKTTHIVHTGLTHRIYQQKREWTFVEAEAVPLSVSLTLCLSILTAVLPGLL